MRPLVVCTLVILSICEILGPPTGDKTTTTKDGVVHAENNGTEGYYFRFATKDQNREERGQFVNGTWTVTGRAGWRSPDGVEYQFSYIADHLGYRVVVIPSTLTTEQPPTTTSSPELSFRFDLGPGALASLAGG